MLCAYSISIYIFPAPYDHHHHLNPGDDIVVMVVNEGELDLFVNFACSCRFHSISMSHILVFAGSEGMVRIVEATGAMGLYHTGKCFFSGLWVSFCLLFGILCIRFILCIREYPIYSILRILFLLI